MRHTAIYEYCFILSKGRPNHIQVIMDKPNKNAGKMYCKGGGRTVDGERILKNKERGTFITPEYGARTTIWECTNAHKDRRRFEIEPTLHY